jgi:hypothetical protein
VALAVEPDAAKWPIALSEKPYRVQGTENVPRRALTAVVVHHESTLRFSRQRLLQECLGFVNAQVLDGALNQLDCHQVALLQSVGDVVSDSPRLTGLTPLETNPIGI